MSACKSCGAPVVWANTEAGKRIPLDATITDPVDRRARPTEVSGGGLEAIGWTGPFRIVRVVPGGGNLRSHFVTCPNAKQHRR